MFTGFILQRENSRYLLKFSWNEKYMDEAEYNQLSGLAEDIGKMLCGMLRKM